MFNGVGVCSDFMFDVLNVFFIIMEFFFKMYFELKVGGVFLIYSKVILFILFIEGIFKVWIGIEIWDIGFFL